MKQKLTGVLRRIKVWLFHHRGEIIYYICVLGVLAVIAVGAQQYRSSRTAPEPVSLPAVQIEAPEPEQAKFMLPEGMRRIAAYSAEPLWNAQDQSWQAHPAADYTSEDGCIRAISDGTIIEMGKSAVLGGYVLLESGEVQLKYCCIEPAEELQIGTNIKIGEILGSAADVMPGEMHLGAHLHLETYRDGKSIDPESLLPGSD